MLWLYNGVFDFLILCLYSKVLQGKYMLRFFSRVPILRYNKSCFLFEVFINIWNSLLRRGQKLYRNEQKR